MERAKQFRHVPLCSETSSNTSKAVMLSEDQRASEMSDSESSESMFLQLRKEDKSTCSWNGAAAFLASFMLQGAGVITENDASSVTDKNKISRARKKRRMDSVALNKTALYTCKAYTLMVENTKRSLKNWWMEECINAL